MSNNKNIVIGAPVVQGALALGILVGLPCYAMGYTPTDSAFYAASTGLLCFLAPFAILVIIALILITILILN